ncbi:MAG: HAMP domain-containing histidine kinase [Ramlibacter sp.]|nr:HAMP domain-containing histidine kinase [Ramlibacter sp.]
MHSFLMNNRDELIARCKTKVARRPLRSATSQQLANGVPMFLEQLTRTLAAEEAGGAAESLLISGPAGGDANDLSEMGVSAAAHGEVLLGLGYSVDQVVHDYGDLCQSITDLAFERDAPFAVDEFRTLNRCLDNAIADAVTEYSSKREATISRQQSADANERLGFLVHELRNALGTATLAMSALDLGNLTVGGATGAVLRRSLSALEMLITRSINEVKTGVVAPRQTFSVAAYVAEAKHAAQLHAATSNCTFVVLPVDPTMLIHANRDLLLAALANLLQNAFKFTHVHTEVTLQAHGEGDRVLIEVSDHCGGLPSGGAENMFTPFTQRNDDKSGLGLGLSIARQNIEADAGVLSVRDVPGTGCVFTISIPRAVVRAPDSQR